MKSSKAQIHGRFHKIPTIKFDDRKLTSFGGIVIFMALFRLMGLKKRLTNCFQHLKSSGSYGMPVIILMMILHIVLGFRRIRSIDYYRDDALLRHVLGLRNRLPDVGTVSRNLGKVDKQAVKNYLRLIKEIFHERILEQGFSRLTIDFDGSVVWTRGRAAEGTAVGFNKQRKGARSYYPLLCTCAQTGQVVDMLFRSGNVHDSNGAIWFILQNIVELRNLCPNLQIECRFDGAFFDQKLLGLLDALGVEFTISVPFERLCELKTKIEERQRWKRIDRTWSFFEQRWKPKSWDCKYRFVFIRQKVALQRKGPVQLDMYVPQDHEHEYKVIVTNKKISAKKVLMFHNGRGSQEGIIGELKQSAQFDYIPFRKQVANQLFMCTTILAHNLTRELQMIAEPRRRGTTEKRAACWIFKKLATLRHEILLRAGRLANPGGELTLTMSNNKAVQRDIDRYLSVLKAA